jgi:hypothetical protein
LTDEEAAELEPPIRDDALRRTAGIKADRPDNYDQAAV